MFSDPFAKYNADEVGDAVVKLQKDNEKLEEAIVFLANQAVISYEHSDGEKRKGGEIFDFKYLMDIIKAKNEN